SFASLGIPVCVSARSELGHGKCPVMYGARRTTPCLCEHWRPALREVRTSLIPEPVMERDMSRSLSEPSYVQPRASVRRLLSVRKLSHRAASLPRLPKKILRTFISRSGSEISARQVYGDSAL